MKEISKRHPNLGPEPDPGDLQNVSLMLCFYWTGPINENEAPFEELLKHSTLRMEWDWRLCPQPPMTKKCRESEKVLES